MPHLILFGLSLLFTAPLWLCLSLLGWPTWIACLGPASVGLILWNWAKSEYRLQNKATCLSPRESLWFYGEVSIVLLAVLLSGVAAYLLTARLVTRDSAIVQGLVAGNPKLASFSGIDKSPPRSHSQRGATLYPPEKPGPLGYVRYVFSLSAMFLAWLVISSILFPSRSDGEDDTHVRGRRLVSYDKARRISERLVQNDERPFFFGGLWLPSWAASTHFAVVGTTGSGKTLTLRLLMQSVLPWLGPESGGRALVYDAKRDVLSLLHGMGLSCPVKTLNPFDQRCVAWNIAKDCTEPATALEIATILIPKEEGPQRFFPDAARHLLYGVLVSLMKSAPEDFTFRDVVLAMQSERSLRELLSRTVETRHLVEEYLDAREFPSIRATIATKMAPFEIIAAAWSRAEESVSLQDWLTGSYVLVLGNDESIRAALEAVNQVIFKRIVELVLAQTDSETCRTWFFLDEVREAGKLDGLSRLLTMGRSKGASIVLGLQDIEGLRDVYGEEVANEIIGQCSHKAMLRLSSEGTAQWASKTLGELERHEYHQSTTRGGQNQSTTTTEQLVKREAVLPSEFMTLPPTNPENGLTGFYLSPEIGAYRAALSGAFLAESLLPRNDEVPDSLPRPVADQFLEPWTEEDLRRLKLPIGPHLPPSRPAPVEPKPEADAKLKVLKRKGGNK